jgi:hypothetical protein
LSGVLSFQPSSEADQYFVCLTRDLAALTDQATTLHLCPIAPGCLNLSHAASRAPQRNCGGGTHAQPTAAAPSQASFSGLSQSACMTRSATASAAMWIRRKGHSRPAVTKSALPMTRSDPQPRFDTLHERVDIHPPPRRHVVMAERAERPCQRKFPSLRQSGTGRGRRRRTWLRS